MNIWNRLFWLTSLLVIAACNDDMNFEITDPDDRIVIDGWIENGQYAKVLLTRNSPYFSSVDSSSIRDLVLTRAKVSLSDGERSEVLILRRNEEYFPPFVFQGNEIKGIPGKTYTITAEYGGRKAWAHTSIPVSVGLDTVYFKPEADNDSLGSLFLEFTDPSEIKNYYRVLTRRQGKDPRYYSSTIMGIDDQFFNGQKFGFSIRKAPETFLSSDINEYYKLGDTVSIKFCTIDKEHYEFWSSFQDEVFNSSNPFATSLTVIKSNIEGDGLGIWGGYGVSHYSFIVK